MIKRDFESRCLQETIYKILSELDFALNRRELLNLVSHAYPVSDRELREVVSSMPFNGYNVGSSQRGYFIIRCQEDLDEASKYSISYIKSLNKKMLKLRDVSSLKLRMQLELPNLI